MNQLSLTTNQVHIVDMLIRKNPKLDRGILETAVAFIADAHEGQYRKSGMPYTEHPYEVAKILADLKQIDQDGLKKYGKVRILNLDELFPND